MPKKYEQIRDNCKKQGGGDAECKTKAAKIYPVSIIVNNATRGKGDKPVTGKDKK